MQLNFITVRSEAFIKGDNHVAASISRLPGHSSLICPLLLYKWALCALETLDSLGYFVCIGWTPFTASYYLGFSSAFWLVFVGEPGRQQPVEARDQNAAACGKHDCVFTGLLGTRLHSDLLRGSKVIQNEWKNSRMNHHRSLPLLYLGEHIPL